MRLERAMNERSQTTECNAAIGLHAITKATFDERANELLCAVRRATFQGLDNARMTCFSAHRDTMQT